VDGAGGEPWIVRAPPDAPVEEGEEVGLRLDAARAHLFDPGDGTRIGVLGGRGQ
jgi:hypothetical protein